MRRGSDPGGSPDHGDPRRIRPVLLSLMAAVFLAALDQTIMATMTRTIADDLHGFDLQVWLTTGFLVTSTISTPLYGKLSDIYGCRGLFLFAIAVFVVGSGLCGLARNMHELAAYRAVQGIGAGGLMSLPLAIISDIVAPRERAKYQSYFLAVFATSSVIGPILGGLFAGTDTILGAAGWRWAFDLNVPIGITVMAVIARVLRLPHQHTDHRIDWPGALALVVGLVPLLIVAEQGRSWGWDSPRALGCFATGALGLTGFVLAERAYEDDALLPLRLFRSRTVAIGAASSAIVGMTMFGGMMTVPLYLQIVKGSSPTAAGLQMIPFVIGIMAGSFTAGGVIARTGHYRIFPIAGAAVMALALGLFATIGTGTPLWRIMLIMVLMGVGLGGNMQPMVSAVQNAVLPREIGVASGMVTFFRSMGGALGTAALLTILFNTLPGEIGSATRAARRTPQFQQALAADPHQAQILRQAIGRVALNNTAFLSRLPEAVAHPFRVAFAESMHWLFLFALAVVILKTVMVLLLPKSPT